MTPIEYHLAGIAMVMIALLIGRFGPEDTRGWPSGIRTAGGRVVLLALMAIAWPPFAFVYAFAGVVLTLQKLWDSGAIKWTVISTYAVCAAVMACGAVYWLLFSALPFLLRWYGVH